MRSLCVLSGPAATAGPANVFRHMAKAHSVAAGQRIQVRRRDLTAEATDVAETQIIGDHQQDNLVTAMATAESPEQGLHWRLRWYEDSVVLCHACSLLKLAVDWRVESPAFLMEKAP